MRIIKKLLPHFTIALAVVLLVVVIVDVYNPMMGFLKGWPFQVLVILEVVCSLITALCLVFHPSATRKGTKGKYEKK